MGQWFRFVCDTCGYEVQVSGGPDAGVTVSVQTMSCSGCSNLVDVIVNVHAWNGEEDRRLGGRVGTDWARRV
jgi:hypothetical protein